MTFYLYENENPHAPVRSNGKRFWGYPTRSVGNPQFIVVHTAENLPDVNPPDMGAENVANYFANTSRPVSAHSITDSDSTIRCLPDEATGFHVRGYNSAGWGIEIATQAAKWNQLPDTFVELLLRRAAVECARVADKYDIPTRFLTRSQIDSGMRGFTGHTNLDPTRRSDPGFTTTQWQTFLQYVQEGSETEMHDHTPPAGSTHDWADDAWDEWVERSGTNPDSRSWNFQREDLSWVYQRVLKSYEQQIAVLEFETQALRNDLSTLNDSFVQLARETAALVARVDDLENAAPGGLTLPFNARISEIP